MATFKVKTFNELSGKGQNGDIAIIERADVNGNKGFSFRDGSGWALPFVQVETLGSNLMTTNTSQSVSAAKTFQGEVVVNDDFSVIGATDIDLGFTGNLTIDAGSESGSEVSIENVDNVIISADNTITFNSSALTAGITSVFVASEKVDLNSNDTFTVETSYAGDTNVAGLIVSDKTPARGVYMEYNNSTTPSYQLVSSTRDNVVLSSQYGTNTSELKLESNTTTITADIFNVAVDDVSITGTLTVTNADSESILGIVGTGQGFSHISENATRSANLNCLLDSGGEPASIMSCNDTSYPAYGDDSVGSQVASSAAGASISFTNYTDVETSAVTVDNFGITLTAPTDKGISFTLATYADNAAAVLGGLAVGKIYKTATGELRIVV